MRKKHGVKAVNNWKDYIFVIYINKLCN
ncbi:hypothetical protein AGR4A_Cc190113 [Agrobacterium tumefaciens str. B6]|uniref:Uncharacterized protein n=2 Tax=Agrobacterium tumefaciens TaxID=358 RepID=A0A822UY63_AGRTU|nr:hypothetical protein AGR4C_Cc100103 [Agrobacterium tumefaciens str. Kerr 14]CUX18025.1 hypothetical protein AGR4B_Cc60455 [Agrobacterium tumefaciens str. CFBP 5621]CVI15388.1 hypothetical protein AGR4A_Cc190113 [Agrobacterium tumefaciens str. B6]